MAGSLDNQGTSTRPYLLRALHDWCTDNGFTPYVAVQVGAGVQVPMEYVKNNEIVLNVSFEATSDLKLGNECIQFRARFGGITREIIVPVGNVVAIYARENGQGMAFPMPTEGAPAQTSAEPLPLRGLRLAKSEPEPQPEPEPEPPAVESTTPPDEKPDPDQPPASGRPSLKRIK